MANEIHIGSNLTGNAIAGNHNRASYHTSVDGQAPDPAHTDGLPSAPLPRFGFAVDVVGYGTRTEPLRQDIESRLRSLVASVLDDIGVASTDVDTVDTGDGMKAFLPTGTELTRTLPRLLAETPARLARDNARFRDRMRLRMAVGTGLLGPGFSGPLTVNLSRLLDSAALRRAVDKYPDSDLVVLIADALHDDVVRPYLDTERYGFQRVHVSVKEFSGVAWLWAGVP